MGMSPGNQQTDSPIKRALRAINDLQAKLSAMENAKTEPVAVIGMGCRFPGGADNPALFWKLLKNGEDATTDLPGDRWNIDEYYDSDPDAPGKMYMRRGGFLGSIDRFDATFFGISPREAVCMDPQHRLVLEVSWEALEYAGIATAGLNGSRTGVFVGIGQNGYARLKLGGADKTQIDTYDGTGNFLCFAPGRLAYILGLRGPNLAIDTACSSSLVAIHQACQSLRVGDCDLALAGGVQLVISPEITIFLSRAHVLSPDGRCKTFDAAADGFGRGEGCGMIVLKRLSDALKDRDTILALIRGSAINHDGTSSGLTVPNERAQEQLILQAIQNANVEPNRVTYIEAHGTGTSLGDPIEVNALAASLCKDRTSDNPLIIGSVKTNIGHLEAAAGIAGVIKVIISLQHKEIPPHLHFRIPNPHIDWKEIPIEVASDGRAWLPTDGPRIAGVSSFGFSGTNAHIVLEEASEVEGRPAGRPNRPAGTGSLYHNNEAAIGEQCDTSSVGATGRSSQHILALSAKSDVALHCLCQRYEEYLAEHPEQAKISSNELRDICFTANTGRSPFAKRIAVIAATVDELRERFAAYREGRACTGLYTQDKMMNAECGMMNKKEPAIDASHSSLIIHNSSFENESLADLANRFVKGGVIAWNDYYRGDDSRKVALPTYPFQRQRYWVEESVNETPREETPKDWNKSLPAWGRRLHLPFSREVRFENRLSENSPAHLSDHRLLGSVVVSAASQVLMVMASVAEAFGTDGAYGLRIGEMVFSQPLIIPVKGEKLVQLIFLPEDEGALSFRLVSAEYDLAGANLVFDPSLIRPIEGRIQDSPLLKWTTHSSGTVFIAPGNEPITAGWVDNCQLKDDFQFDQAKISNGRSQAVRILKGDEFYAARLQLGYQFGSSFRWVERMLQGENETLCKMVPRFQSGEGDAYPLHPGLLDSCFQMIDGLQDTDQDGEHLFVPVRIENLRFYRQPPSGSLWCVARREAHDGANARTRKGSLQLMDENGDVIVAVDGFELGRARRELFIGRTPIISPPKEAIYNVLWRPAPPTGESLLGPGSPHPSAARRPVPPTGESVKSRWLLFADQSGIATELATQLLARGDDVILVTQEKQYIAYKQNAGDSPPLDQKLKSVSLEYRRFSDSAFPNGLSFTEPATTVDRYGVNPEVPEDFRRLFRAIGMPLKGIIYLWGIDIGQTMDEEAILRSEIVCGGLSAVVRAILEQESGVSGTLWFVTKGTLPVGAEWSIPPDASSGAALQALLWGIGSVLDLEHPELCRGIDLDPLESEAMIPMFLEEILHPDAENRVALRKGVRHTARLEICDETQEGGFHFDADASYLITGGLGGLGLEVAHWMARNGARNLILSGRNAPMAPAAEKIGRIEQTGCNVLVFTADVSDRKDVKRLLSAIESRMLPLRGIVHAAGVTNDAILIRQERGSFRKVMAPKVRGTWNLHEVTAGKPLDFFVCFSSAAAIIGSGGQANYAAANAFMDAFVHARRRQGLHGLSVNWGAWGEVGMAAKMKDEVRERMAAQGMGAIVPEKGLEILGDLLRRDETQALVMAVDWDRYLESHYSKEPPPFFEAVAGGRAAPEMESSIQLAGWLNETPVGERHARLFDYVRSQVAATLGMTSPEQLEPRQRLFDIGIDSLMAVELKNRLESGLGIPLRSTLVFDYPTVAALVKHLSEDVLSPLFPQVQAETIESLLPADLLEHGFYNDKIGSMLLEIEAIPEQELMAMLTSRKPKNREAV